MDKKNKYFTPVTETVNLNLADRILGASDWLLLGGQGDFSYEIEEDNEFAGL